MAGEDGLDIPDPLGRDRYGEPPHGDGAGQYEYWADAGAGGTEERPAADASPRHVPVGVVAPGQIGPEGRMASGASASPEALASPGGPGPDGRPAGGRIPEQRTRQGGVHTPMAAADADFVDWISGLGSADEEHEEWANVRATVDPDAGLDGGFGDDFGGGDRDDFGGGDDFGGDRGFGGGDDDFGGDRGFGGDGFRADGLDGGPADDESASGLREADAPDLVAGRDPVAEDRPTGGPTPREWAVDAHQLAAVSPDDEEENWFEPKPRAATPPDAEEFGDGDRDRGDEENWFEPRRRESGPPQLPAAPPSPGDAEPPRPGYPFAGHWPRSAEELEFIVPDATARENAWPDAGAHRGDRYPALARPPEQDDQPNGTDAEGWSGAGPTGLDGTRFGDAPPDRFGSQRRGARGLDAGERSREWPGPEPVRGGLRFDAPGGDEPQPRQRPAWAMTLDDDADEPPYGDGDETTLLRLPGEEPSRRGPARSYIPYFMAGVAGVVVVIIVVVLVALHGGSSPAPAPAATQPDDSTSTAPASDDSVPNQPLLPTGDDSGSPAPTTAGTTPAPTRPRPTRTTAQPAPPAPHTTAPKPQPTSTKTTQPTLSPTPSPSPTTTPPAPPPTDGGSVSPSDQSDSG